ncbi:MAG: sulfatase [Pirellulaceae bacterium]
MMNAFDVISDHVFQLILRHDRAGSSRIDRFRATIATIVLTACCSCASAQKPAEQERAQRSTDEHVQPNILLILADDLGWRDLTCYGNPWFDTPHLDRLAEQGMRFTDAYAAAPICSASRAGLLTGKTPARLGFEFVTKNEPGFQPVEAPLRAPPFTLDLPLKEETVAEVLREAGYKTAFFGKWHLNRHYKRYLGWSPTHGPVAQGFETAEEDFGSHPYSYWNNRSDRTFIDLATDEFPEDTMIRRAGEFLHQPHDRPFFLMVSQFFVHTPVHTRARWLYDRNLARIPANHPRREALAHYGAMVVTLDHLVGRLLQALEDAGQTRSTMVVFTSDNGGHPEYYGNAPLRGSKWNLYEGGIRVPLIIRWPGRIRANSVSNRPVCGIDLLPTLANIAGAEPPTNLDGHSFAFVFDEPTPPRDEHALLWHFPYYHPEGGFADAPAEIGINDGYTSQTRPHSALRLGPWKLLHFYEDNRDELYHLPTDPAEQHDRGIGDPEVAGRLRRLLDARLRECNARLPTARPPLGQSGQ